MSYGVKAQNEQITDDEESTERVRERWSRVKSPEFQKPVKGASSVGIELYEMSFGKNCALHKQGRLNYRLA